MGRVDCEEIVVAPFAIQMHGLNDQQFPPLVSRVLNSRDDRSYDLRNDHSSLPLFPLITEVGRDAFWLGIEGIAIR